MDSVCPCGCLTENVRMPSTINRGPRQIWQALLWSLKGLREGWRVEASFRLEMILCLVLFPIGLRKRCINGDRV